MSQLPEFLQNNESSLPQVEDLQQLFVSGVALLDTRAPVEFADGAFPSSENLPLMSDEERRMIGTCYKELGQDAAIDLGLELVSGDVKAQRIQQWQQFVEKYPDGVLYCFRGGLRSRITQQWIYEKTGVIYPRVKGGYKALRSYLLQQLEALPVQLQPYILSGRTGSGKTILLKTLEQQIDLEGLANHRGSAFGPQITPQPTQINFENALAINLLQQLAKDHSALVFEDESPNIGSVHVPKTLFNQLSQSKLVMLEVSNEERSAISYQEYVVDMVAGFTLREGSEEAGFAAFSDYILGSVDKIRRRLGGVRHQEVWKMMLSALEVQQRTGATEAHRQWVEFILFDYYDPMYDYQMSKKAERLEFRGDKNEVREYLADQGIG
uniref:tRNA 2-selenouridine synthase n=1 Tax=uncultured Thiotrichaceae bacterium TaxID=298394 RepID=A0A6S6TV10_9GAMM|nr:MAG: Selenophosphate-dependent tRNA 2-selenouridine synthase [uncultured Thiotrichaceae bacterium]